MNARLFINIVLAVLFVITPGCKKKLLHDEGVVFPAIWAASPDSNIRVHWLGRKHLDLSADAYYVSRIWSLPESLGLQQQTGDKLATNFVRMAFGDAAERIPPAVSRSMFDDVALQECYFESRGGADSELPYWCFAIHVGEHRAAAWAMNLTLASEMLLKGPSSVEPGVHGWIIQGTNANMRATVSSYKDWVIISLGPPKNVLFEEVAERLFRGGGVRLTEGTGDYWLEADIDLNRAAHTLLKNNSELPRVKFAVTGDGSQVIIEGHLTFSNALSLPITSWNIPTNAIHEPLLNFTSVRGIQALLGKWQIWNNLHITPPGQLFFWSLEGNAYQIYAAAPSSDTRRDVSAIGDFLLQKGNSWLATNGYIGFHPALDGNGVVWGNVPSITPFIRALDSSGDGWIYGGLLGDPGFGTNSPLSSELLRTLNEQTNLVFFDWELTGRLLPPRLLLLQTARQMSRKPEIPTDSVSMNWLGALRARLGTTQTTVRQIGPGEFAFYRKSTIGFTALELHLLADWLESPDFPRGTRSQLGN